MPSCWIERRKAKSGVRYRVEYRLGARESRSKYAGSFVTMREAKLRRDWVAGELAALRVPELSLLVASPPLPTLRAVAERWRASRVDVAAGTAATYDVNLARILPQLGDHAAAELRPDDIANLVAELAASRLARESIRKTLATLPMVLDYAGITPNVARDRLIVKLPREAKAEIAAPARGAHPRGAPDPPASIPAAAARARRDRNASGRARATELGRRRRAARPLARLTGCREDQARPMDISALSALRGHHGARGA
jgi:hypothetical protein